MINYWSFPRTTYQYFRHYDKFAILLPAHRRAVRAPRTIWLRRANRGWTNAERTDHRDGVRRRCRQSALPAASRGADFNILIAERMCSLHAGGTFERRTPPSLGARTGGGRTRHTPTTATACAVAAAKVRCPPTPQGVRSGSSTGPLWRRGAPLPVLRRCGCSECW